MNKLAIAMAFTKDIMALVRAVMDSPYGINDKVHRNTLHDSNVYKDMTVEADIDDNIVLKLLMNHYIHGEKCGKEYGIEVGRSKGAKFPPVEPIVEWAKKHGIPTDNSTIFLIRRAISRDGISPRPIMKVVFEEFDKKWDKDWADELFDEITKLINDFFNK